MEVSLHPFELFIGPAGDDKSVRMARRAKELSLLILVVDYKNVWDDAGLGECRPVQTFFFQGQASLDVLAKEVEPGSVLCIDGIQFSRSEPEDEHPEVALHKLIRAAWKRKFFLLATWTGDCVPESLGAYLEA